MADCFGFRRDLLAVGGAKRRQQLKGSRNPTGAASKHSAMFSPMRADQILGGISRDVARCMG